MRATAPSNETHRAFLPSRADAALAIPMTPGRASGSRQQFGAATIMRHRGERADHRQVAHVAGAVIGFEAPDRNDQWTRHAELPLNAREQRRMALQHLLAALDADGGNAGRGVILEAFAKSAALAAVEGEHRRIESDAS